MNLRRSLLREGFGLLHPLHVVAQIGLAAVVCLLVVVWLRLSDASVMWLACTVVLGVVIVFTAGAGQAALLLALARERQSGVRLLRGAVIVLGLLVLWCGWTALLAHHGDDSQRAGYVYSALPAGLRQKVTYGHLVLLQRWFWDAVAWMGTGVLAALLLPLIAGRKPLRASACALRSVSFWGVLIAGALVASMLSGELIQWTPGLGLAIEVVSLVGRLGVSAAIDAFVVCLFLAIVAACVRRVEDQAVTVVGTPDESQPRTVPMP